MSKLLRQNIGGTDYTMAGCALSATCATAAATAAKVAELTDGDVLADGMSVAVQFTNGNTATSPLTLTVGGVTANICDSRGQNIGGNIWQAGNVVTFLYTFGKFLLLNCVVDTVALNNMNSVSSNAVAKNTVRQLNISVQGNDIETCIKAMLDFLSNNTMGSYGGNINAGSVANGSYNAFNIVIPASNYKSAVGFIEFTANTGVYYISRESIGSNAPNYIIKRVDLPSISERHSATKIDARFPSGSNASCFWWRCGRIITVYFYASQVLSTYNHLDPCFSGLPKPIVSSYPQGSPYWGGQHSQFVVVIDDNGNLCTNGNANGGTDVNVSGLCTFTYVTTDN